MPRQRAKGILLLGLGLAWGLTGVSWADDAKVAELEKEGFVKLLNGTTLSGWEAIDAPESWTVQPGGIIRGHGPVSHLFSPKQYGDFEVYAEVMTEPGSNSGLYVRSKKEAGWPRGYETQINNTYHMDPRKTGSLYGQQDVLKSPVKDHEWWSQHVICQGNHIIVKINGEKVVDFVDPKTNSPRKGYIALQQHDPRSTVYFRNIMVKELGP